MPTGYIVVIDNGLLELYNPDSEIPNKVLEMGGHDDSFGRAGTRLNKTDVLLMSEGPRSSFATFHLIKQQYISKDVPEWPVPRVGIAMTSLTDRVFCCGGKNQSGEHYSTVDALDTKLGQSWVMMPNLPHPVAFACALTLTDRILIIGGQNGQKTDQKTLSTVFSFRPDVAGDTWIRCAEMSDPRCCAAACLDDEICVIVSGGCDPNEANLIKSCERYNTTNDIWVGIADLNTARCGHEMVLFQSSVYVLGGRDSEGNAMSEVERYNQRSDTWEPVYVPMKQSHHDFTALVVNKPPPSYNHSPSRICSIL